jgi:hypothetical protein
VNIVKPFPVFHIEKGFASNKQELIGSLSTISYGEQPWIANGWLGQLISNDVVVLGRWKEKDDLWLFLPEHPSDLLKIKNCNEFLAISYQYEVQLVLDKNLTWEKTDFHASDAVRVDIGNGMSMIRPIDNTEKEASLIENGWDHEHCELCWEKIGYGGQASGFYSSEKNWVCENCYENYVKTHSLDFIPDP